MLDSLTSNQRRQPPSPLVFTPESIFASPPVVQQSGANGSSAASASGSSANTVSMPFVRRHVTRRLKAAKSECDKELQRITNNITTFFEERLRESAEQEAEREIFEQERDRARESPAHWQQDGEREAEAAAQAAWFADQSALQTDDSSDGGYEGEGDPQRYGLQRALPELQNVQTLTHKGSSPGLAAASSSSSLSPASLRRTHPVPWDSKPIASSPSSAGSSMILPEAPITRIRGDPPPPAMNPPRTTQGGVPSRRLSRSIHIPARATRSGQSSRSTSRSRSPLPPQTSHASFSDTFQHTTPPPTSSSNRRSSRILLDDPIDPIMTALYDLIAVATDIMEMTLNQLTAQPKVCETFVQRIQNIGKAWESHPNWHGRNWYVQVLLAVASLSRVVEWWEAEKLFWNFDDNEEEADEPLAFVTKQTEEFSMLDDMDHLAPEDDDQHKLGRPTSQNRKSRDEQPKAVGSATSPKDPPETASRSASSKFLPNTESARVLATERLRLQAETAQNQNMVVELSLDGDHVIWVNYAWSVVVGSDADEIPGTRISYCLHPSDLDVFRNASELLQEDQQSKTIQIRFKLQIVPDDDHEVQTGGALYQKMEGNGMLMLDRDDGMPSHTMWVVRPLAPPRFERYPNPTIGPPDLAGMASTSDLNQLESALPFPQPISVEPILCRICEVQIPQWYFEKHSETCVELHRMEAEIAECNESISELRNTVRALALRMDTPSPGAIPEYRGMPILAPSSFPITSSPLHIFKFGKMQKFGVKKMQRRLLDQLDDILQVALEVSVPSLKEEESKEPIERQRLLSPTSERKMTQVRNWSKPVPEDSALSQLVEDTERIMRQKIDSVIRMQNTMRYSEKVWCEWREKVEEFLDLGSDSGSSGGSDDDQCTLDEPDLLSLPPASQPREDDQCSTVSEYAFTGEIGPSSDPTPLAPSPMPPPSSTESRSSSSMAVENRPGSSAAMGARGMQYTRSSTPSSISSPLAYAAPIIASSSPEEPPHIPPMSLDDDSANRSQAIQEPKLFITPPISPMLSAKDVPTVTRENSLGRRHSRRHSINPLAIGATPPSGNPLSPRQSTVPLSRSNPTSIKDFDVIKPISKGAFGSVFLAKKKVTGDYYAIKVLKKADMISKNQITNVKAERMILMKQAESPFVAKLYFTFQSKDNLYLVMEYLNGGDCAALIKSLGSLPEEWTRQYVAEVTLGLEYLHDRGIVHRDLKPDNLLIDSHGHLKLTDFGLSRIGLLGRQSREVASRKLSGRSRPPSLDSAYISSPFLHGEGGSYFSQRTHAPPRVANTPYTLPTDDVDSNASDSAHGWQALRGSKPSDSPLQSFASELTNDLRSHNNMRADQEGNTPPGEQKFVGTPDYLAPETILGLRGDDASWALGVITYEFLYGIPPFHAESPEKLFENILSGRIDWHEDWVDFSYAARDFMERLMTISVPRRLGANGAQEVKDHAFFEGTEWDQITTTEAAFIPQVTDPESTDYFDPRGAIPQLFHDDDDHVAITNRTLDSPNVDVGATLPATAPVAIAGHREHSSSTASSDDFGSFSFKNIPVLKQANDDVIRKLKTDQMVPLAQTLSEPMSLHQRKRSMSTRVKKPPSVVTSGDPNKPPIAGPPSPATSTSSVASSPSRGSMPPSTPGSAASHSRKPSEFGAVERFKINHLDGDRRNSMPSRLRTASVSSTGDGSGSEAWGSSAGQGSNYHETPPSSVHSIDLRKGPDLNDRVVTCLLAEDNPITAKIIETLLIRLGCRCVVVADGSEAISVAMGDIKFDCILMDLQMPVLDGESAAKYIRTTNGKNSNTPIISVSSYSAEGFEANSTFAASLSKPLQKADLLAAMQKLGFKTSTLQGPRASRLTAARPA